MRKGSGNAAFSCLERKVFLKDEIFCQTKEWLGNRSCPAVK